MIRVLSTQSAGNARDLRVVSCIGGAKNLSRGVVSETVPRASLVMTRLHGTCSASQRVDGSAELKFGFKVTFQAVAAHLMLNTPSFSIAVNGFSPRIGRHLNMI